MEDYTPSNGYNRWICDNCLFLEEHNHRNNDTDCKFRINGSRMKWVSAADCERDPEIAAAHHEPCPCFISLEEVRNNYRCIKLKENNKTSIIDIDPNEIKLSKGE